MKRYGPSILDRIRNAKNADDIAVNLPRALAFTQASKQTKRKWMEAAQARLAQLRVERLILP